MIDWFARNSVAANLMMVFIIVSGILATTNVREEVFPEIELDRIQVEVPYLGAAPEEVEEAVNVRIEESIQGIDGIKQIQSTASEGMGSVMIELDLGADARRVVDEVKSNIDAITTFPIETEKPIIRELTNRQQVVDIAVSGDIDPFTLKEITERVRDELTAIPEITQVDIVSAPPYEISIEVSEDDLRRHGMTFDQVADAVRRSSLDLPGGSVRTERGEILLRTIGQAYRGAEFENLVLWTRADGSRLHLGDVATVVDGFEETDQEARFDVEPAMMVSVFRTGDQSAIELAALAGEYVEEAQARLPDGVTLTIWQDSAKMLGNRLSLMIRTGVAGFALVFLVLALFLELRLAFWVSLGIPISFLGAIALIAGPRGLGQRALALRLRPRARHRRRRRHHRRPRTSTGTRRITAKACAARSRGAYEIAKPVTFAILTTVAAFSPLLFVPGMMGKVFRVIPLVVIPCLLFSLVESLNILPAHLSHIPKRVPPGAVAPLPVAVRDRPEALRAGGLRSDPGARAPVALSHGLDRRRHHDRDPRDGALGPARVPVLPVHRGGFHVGLGDDAAGDAGRRPPERRWRSSRRGAARLRQRLLEETGQDYFLHTSAARGRPADGGGGAGGPMGPLQGHIASSNLGEVAVELLPTEMRAYSSEQLGLMWRDATEPIPRGRRRQLHDEHHEPGE